MTCSTVTTEIQLSDDIKRRCELFAEACVGTNLKEYARRGQNKPEVIIQQIYEGKLGEFAVAQYLQTSAPDTKIYGAKQKSWDCDLKLGKHQIHVKTQRAENAVKYGSSILFQKQDKVITKTTDLDVLGWVEMNGDTCTIKALVAVPDIIPLFKEPKLHQLRATKVALYFDDLVSSGTNLWQVNVETLPF